MYKKTVQIVGALSAWVAFAAAQNEVTLYDLSIVPSPSNTATGLSDQYAQVVDAIAQGAGNIRASAISVDGDGTTVYVGVQDVSVIPTAVSGRLTTIVLPTPAPVAFTFRADASRLFQQVHTTSVDQGVTAEVEAEIECTHNVDDDTPVEEAVVVCKHKLGLKAEAEGTTIDTTFLATTTGKAAAFITVTKAADTTAPTESAVSNADDDDAGSGRRNMVSGLVAAAGAVILFQLL